MNVVNSKSAGTDSEHTNAGLVVWTEGMSLKLLQTAGHIFTQVAPHLDGVSLGNEGSPLLTPVTSFLNMGSKLIPSPVSVSLAVQGEVSPQGGGVATQPAVTATGDQGAPFGLRQGARGVQVLLHGL